MAELGNTPRPAAGPVSAPAAAVVTPLGGVPLPAFLKPVRTAADTQTEKGTFGRAVVAFATLWVVLTLTTESDDAAPLAAAFAGAIAITATLLYLPTAASNLGLKS